MRFRCRASSERAWLSSGFPAAPALPLSARAPLLPASMLPWKPRLRVHTSHSGFTSAIPKHPQA